MNNKLENTNPNSRNTSYGSAGAVLSQALTKGQAEGFGEILLALGERVVGISLTEEMDGFQVEIVTSSGAVVGLVDERGMQRLLGSDTKEAQTPEEAAKQGFLRILQESKQLKVAQQKRVKGVAPRVGIL